MNFSDLLDEDGQGTRRCDAWLAENIGEWEIERNYYYEETDREYYWYVHNPNTGVNTSANRNINEVLNEENLPRYTTGDSIDPIWKLAKEYFDDKVTQLVSSPLNKGIHLFRTTDSKIINQY